MLLGFIPIYTLTYICEKNIEGEASKTGGLLFDLAGGLES